LALSATCWTSLVCSTQRSVSRRTHYQLDGAILDIRLGAVASYPVAHALKAGVPFAFATSAGEAAADDASENRSFYRSRSTSRR